MTKRELAVVDSVEYGMLDLGMSRGMSSFIQLVGIERDAWRQSFGGLRLNDETGAFWKAEIVELFGVNNFEDIRGRQCFVLRSKSKFGSLIEGLEVDGRQFTIAGFKHRWASFSDEWQRHPSEDNIHHICSKIDDNVSNIQKLVEQLRIIHTDRSGQG